MKKRHNVGSLRALGVIAVSAVALTLSLGTTVPASATGNSVDKHVVYCNDKSGRVEQGSEDAAVNPNLNKVGDIADIGGKWNFKLADAKWGADCKKVKPTATATETETQPTATATATATETETQPTATATATATETATTPSATSTVTPNNCGLIVVVNGATVKSLQVSMLLNGDGYQVGGLVPVTSDPFTHTVTGLAAGTYSVDFYDAAGVSDMALYKEVTVACTSTDTPIAAYPEGRTCSAVYFLLPDTNAGEPGIEVKGFIGDTALSSTDGANEASKWRTTFTVPEGAFKLSVQIWKDGVLNITYTYDVPAATECATDTPSPTVTPTTPQPTETTTQPTTPATAATSASSASSSAAVVVTPSNGDNGIVIEQTTIPSSSLPWGVVALLVLVGAVIVLRVKARVRA